MRSSFARSMTCEPRRTPAFGTGFSATNDSLSIGISPTYRRAKWVFPYFHAGETQLVCLISEQIAKGSHRRVATCLAHRISERTHAGRIPSRSPGARAVVMDDYPCAGRELAVKSPHQV